MFQSENLDLVRAYSLLSATLDAAADGILVTDRDGNIVRYNEKFLRLWRIPEEIVKAGKTAPAISFVLDQVRDPAFFLRRISEISQLDADVVDIIPLKDGRLIERSCRRHVLKVGPGDKAETLGRVYSFCDVTERMRGEQERDIAYRRSKFLEKLSMLLVTLDHTALLRGVVESCAQSMADLCFVDLVQDRRYRRIASTIDPRVTPQLLEKLEGHWSEANCFGSSCSAESGGVAGVIHLSQALRLGDVDREWARGEIGLDFPIRSFISLPLLVRGKCLGALSFANFNRLASPHEMELAEEVARRVALAVDHALLYDRTRSATQAYRDLVAMVSHDLKTPLTAIKMNTELMSRAISSSSEGSLIQKQISAIRSSADGMGRLIGDLLDQARIEYGSIHIEPRAYVLEALIHDAIEQLCPIASAKGIRLSHVGVGHPMTVNCDRERVLQVLGNLIGNAIKFSPENSEVRVVQKSVDDDTGLVTIEDQGEGIGEQELPHVFDRFWQSRKQNGSGYGLGLSIAKGIVEQHGGKIWAESIPGQGSSFHFTLALAKAGQETSESASL